MNHAIPTLIFARTGISSEVKPPTSNAKNTSRCRRFESSLAIRHQPTRHAVEHGRGLSCSDVNKPKKCPIKGCNAQQNPILCWV